MSDRILGGFGLALAVFYIWAATIIPESFMVNVVGPKTFPIIIGLVITFCSVVFIVKPDAMPEWPQFSDFAEIVFAVPAEHFVLFTLAFAALGGISSTNQAKSAFATMLGLGIAMIGVDTQTGVQRFTFGQLHLMDGTDFLIAIVGLSALSEVLIFMEYHKGGSAAKSGADITVGRLTPSWSVLKSTRWTMVRASIIGFIAGVLPGAGPLPASIEQALAEGKAICAITSGNRNFPGRVHSKLDLGFLASPPLVVAYAIKGFIQGDILTEPLAKGRDGAEVDLADLWPTEAEIEFSMTTGFAPKDVAAAFARSAVNPDWHQIDCPDSMQFPWDPQSRNLRRPKSASLDETTRLGRYRASPLLVLGDDMTTDHISPAGWIDPDNQAGQWLIERGGDPQDLNIYAAYGGNWEVMLRGLFTNRLA